MRYLGDANLFVALAVGQHARHETARDWFQGLGEEDELLFCRATQMSFLRLLTQRIAVGYQPVTNRRAWQLYAELLSDCCSGWAPEPEGAEDLWQKLSARKSASPKLWMDAWLAACAIAGGLRFVTFDRGFRQFAKHGLDLHLLAPSD